MNLIAWLLGLSLLIVLMVEAVAFHRATVCRQKAWLKSTELLTRATLTKAPAKDQVVDLSCRVKVSRNGESITWQRLPHLSQNNFFVSLKGSL